VIVDVRKSTNGMDELRQAFHEVDVLFETAKFWRIIARDVRR
jgi:hypothetical protein